MGKPGMKAHSSHVVSLDVCAPINALSREGQWTLKLEEKITRLFDELREPVWRYLLCRGVSPTEADEIVQETFLRLYRHLHPGGREDNLRGWVFRVAHNISINELKSRRFLVLSGSEQWAELNTSSIDPAPGPEERLLRKERMVRAHAAISALSEQQKQCLYLRAEGFRYREIADILGVTISTVAEFLRRAIKKLTKESDG
jgi:RNA polymerase sigma-70 factor (ECF subfamily)